MVNDFHADEVLANHRLSMVVIGAVFIISIESHAWVADGALDCLRVATNDLV